MFLCDFHTHSKFSDGKMTIPEVVDLYGKRGFGAIAITDHICESQQLVGQVSAYLGYCLTEATFPLYREILRSEAERAWDQYQMVVIPGVEYSKNSIRNHRSAHILGLGIDEYFSADGDVKEICKAIRSRGGLSIAAHPVWTRVKEKQTFFLWDNVHNLENDFDAWEVASGSVIFDEVARTKLPKIASSDLHRPSQIQSWKTTLTCEKKPEAILEAIKRQELGFHFYTEEIHDSFRVPSTRPMAYRPGHHAVGHSPLAQAV